MATIINRRAPRAEKLKAELLRNGWVNECRTVLLNDKESISKSFETANVVVTCTNTNTPLWDTEDHPNESCVITGIGRSFTPMSTCSTVAITNTCSRGEDMFFELLWGE
jgi:ornithine cyclodeaminase/alanine dehydrogenase-like protein (mu-crystallin family)